MANIVGTSKNLRITPIGGALADPPNTALTISDEAVVTAESTSDPLVFKLTFQAVGNFEIDARATNSDGDQVLGSIIGDVTTGIVAATLLQLTLEDI
jgi:hypothetical protein